MTIAFDSGQSISRIHQREIVEDDPIQYANPQAELLEWHYSLGHLSFARIQKLVEQGVLE